MKKFLIITLLLLITLLLGCTNSTSNSTFSKNVEDDIKSIQPYTQKRKKKQP